MRDRRRVGRPGSLRLTCGVAALALALAGCSSAEEPDGGSGGGSGSPSSSTPEATGPGPESSVELYSLEKPKSDIEGEDRQANQAVASFAEAMSNGDREAVEAVLYAPTPQDQSVVDKSLRIYEGTNWDLSGVRWTEDGVHGPCYLLQGEAADGTPVHMAGWAAWNDTLEEWEFGTLGLPGSASYPDVPSC